MWYDKPFYHNKIYHLNKKKFYGKEEVNYFFSLARMIYDGSDWLSSALLLKLFFFFSKTTSRAAFSVKLNVLEKLFGKTISLTTLCMAKRGK